MRLVTRLFPGLQVSTDQGRRDFRALMTSVAGISYRVVDASLKLMIIPLATHLLGIEKYGIWLTASSILSLLDGLRFWYRLRVNQSGGSVCGPRRYAQCPLVHRNGLHRLRCACIVSRHCGWMPFKSRDSSPLDRHRGKLTPGFSKPAAVYHHGLPGCRVGIPQRCQLLRVCASGGISRSRSPDRRQPHRTVLHLSPPHQQHGEFCAGVLVTDSLCLSSSQYLCIWVPPSRAGSGLP